MVIQECFIKWLTHELQIVEHRDCKPHVKENRQLVREKSTNNVTDIRIQGRDRVQEAAPFFLNLRIFRGLII